MKGSTRWYDAEQLRRISEVTIAHYDRLAEAYWNGTRDHDVTQNYAALLDAIEGDPSNSILDLGCGPGRDLRYFRSLGHDVVGLDGSTEFVAMARSYSECEVLQQDFLAMELPESRFDGIFANASLFHVPSQELPRVLAELSKTLRSRWRFVHLALDDGVPQGSGRLACRARAFLGSEHGAASGRHLSARAGPECRRTFRGSVCGCIKD